MFRILVIILFVIILATDILMLSIAWTHRPFTFREIIESLCECVHDTLRDLLRSRKDG
ncbi:MAG: hypothetical protein IJI45_08125 [Anaerolineaceae bacterium]|nr:hypothetical protein [Anaerolineaceae bacterium]